MRRCCRVFALSLFVILGVVLADFDFFFDSALKSKWYWLYITISIFGLLTLYPRRMSIEGTEKVGIRKDCTTPIFASIVIAAFFVALYGIAQYTGLLPHGGTFKVIGNFDNPAGYASMLALSLPFIIYFTTFNMREIRIVAWIICSLCVIGIIISASRTGIIATMIVSVLYVVNRYRNFITGISWWKRSLSIIIIAMIVAGLYFIKKDSADGRILIWRCTWDMIKEKPLFGHGYKSFESEYMLYQANYFERNPDSKFSLLSDNVKHPFNEYLLVVAEFGIMTIVILILLMVVVVRAYFRNRNKESFVYLLALVSISIFSCFSYPFKYPFTWVILTLSINYLLIRPVQVNIRNKWEHISQFSKSLIVLLSLTVLTFSLKDIYDENRWYSLANFALTQHYKLTITEYDLLATDFEDDCYFQYNYAAQLNYWGEYEKSLSYANKCIKSLNDYDVQMLIADNYYNLSDWSNSLEHYELASQMCPNRFIPLYKMTLIYDTTGRSGLSMELAEKILQKEEKVPSVTIDRIKALMKKKLYMQECGI